MIQHVIGAGPYTVVSPNMVTLTAFASPTAGLYAATPAFGAGGMIHLGSTYGGSHRGVEIVFFGEGADNSTGQYRVWSVEGVADASGAKTIANLSQCLLTGSITLGDLVAPSGIAGVPTGARLAEVVTWELTTPTTTPSGQGQQIVTAYGSPGPQSIATATANQFTSLIIPDVGNANSIYVEMIRGTATNINALTRPIT